MAPHREEMNDWIQKINQALRVDMKRERGAVDRARNLSFEGSVKLTAAASCFEYLISNNRCLKQIILNRNFNFSVLFLLFCISYLIIFLVRSLCNNQMSDLSSGES